MGGASVGGGGEGGENLGEQGEESPTHQETDHYEPPSPHTAEFPVSTMDAIAEEPSGEDTTSNEGSEHNIAEPHDSSDNIKLQRITGVSFRHTKAPPASVLKEGWVVHYTNKSNIVSLYMYYVCLCMFLNWTILGQD